MIQQELEGLAMEQQKREPAPVKMGPPSLPEPTGPPPPPPLDSPAQIIEEEEDVEDDGTQEPIYESVLPRDEPNCVSPTPINVPPPPKFRSPSAERSVIESPRQSRPSSRGSSTGVYILYCNTLFLYNI